MDGVIKDGMRETEGCAEGEPRSQMYLSRVKECLVGKNVKSERTESLGGRKKVRGVR
jgi:hypothetical protein